jgi:2'-hydroxyisoflavone reductase
MDLLIIGGSRFLGRHLVDAALARGDRVTLFNRGQSAPAPAGVTALQGDRQGDLSVLNVGRWDAVVDTCGYLPRDVARMAAALAGRARRYVFISSVSAYASAALPTPEDAPPGTIDDPDTTVVDGRTYGPLKALCEAAAVQAFGAAQTILARPGLIVGPHDPSGRFTWWPARLARAAADGQPVLAPGQPQRALQFIDARDLAAWLLQLVDAGAAGAFNAVVPPGFTTWGGLLQACAAAAGVQPMLTWVPDQHLLSQGVQPWMDLPLWLPSEGPDAAGHAAFMAVPTTRAQANGLVCRPLAETVVDTLAWWRALPAGRQVFGTTGLALEREAAVLAAFLATGQAATQAGGSISR